MSVAHLSNQSFFVICRGYSIVPTVQCNNSVCLCVCARPQRVQAALQAVNAVQGGTMLGSTMSGMGGGMGATMSVGGGEMGARGMATQSPVLRVIVENLFYPVTLEVLHQVRTLHQCLLVMSVFKWFSFACCQNSCSRDVTCVCCPL